MNRHGYPPHALLARQHSLGGREVALKIVRRHNGEDLCLARFFGVLALRVAIVSTPRSGNTWLLHLLSKTYQASTLAVHSRRRRASGR